MNIEIFEENAPEILLDLAEQVRAELVKNHNMDEQQARKIGVDVALKIANNWAGELIYIPQSVALMSSERNLAIWREFDGKNHRELARKYGVSMQWVYKVIKRVQRQEVEKRQLDIFCE